MFEGMDWSTASGDEIEQGLTHFGGLYSAAAAELCALIQAADRSQMWMGDGARSLSEWVSLRLRIRFATAKRLVSVARRLESLPHLFESFACGDLSLDQVDAISMMANPETEQGLIEEALGWSNHQLDRRARQSDPPTGDDERTVWERRRLVRQWNLDASELRFWGNLPGDAGQILDTAVQDGLQRIPENPETGVFDPVETRAADVLVELAATTGDQSAPPQVTIHTDLEALTSQLPSISELASGALVANETARRLCCDAVVETVIHDRDNITIGVGRNSRTVPGWLRRQVEYRDGYRCRWVGCGARHWLQVHHVIHWADRGPTNLDNLVLLCGYHHRFLHHHGWTITNTGNGRFVFRRPDHSVYPQPPEPLHPRLRKLVATGRTT